jgi:hypothetical protein
VATTWFKSENAHIHGHSLSALKLHKSPKASFNACGNAVFRFNFVSRIPYKWTVPLSLETLKKPESKLNERL